MTGPLPGSIQRHDWVDQARGVALLMVLFQHAGSYGSGLLEVPAAFRALELAQAPFRMPLLMLLSGLFLDRALQKGAQQFMTVKLRQVLWPFLIWTLVSFTLAGEAERLLQLEVWRGRSYLWFLVFLLAYFVVALLLRRVPHLLVAAIALLVSVLARDGSKHGEQMFVLMAYFFVGAFLGRRLDRFTEWMSWRSVLLLAPFAAAAALGSLNTGTVRFNPLWFPVVLPALIGVLALLRQLQALPRAMRLLSGAGFIGRHAVIYYVVNTPLYVALVPWLAVRGLSPWLVIAISLLVAIAVATVLALARSRSPVLALLFEFPRNMPRRQAARLAGEGI